MHDGVSLVDGWTHQITTNYPMADERCDVSQVLDTSSCKHSVDTTTIVAREDDEDDAPTKATATTRRRMALDTASVCLLCECYVCLCAG